MCVVRYNVIMEEGGLIKGPFYAELGSFQDQICLIGVSFTLAWIYA